MRQAIYRAVYRFIVQDGARLVRELEPGLVEGGSLAPAEVAIVRPVAHAGFGTGAISVGSGVTVGRGESRELLTSNIQSLRRYLERSAPEYAARLSSGRLVLEIRPDSMSELSVRTLTVGVRAGAQTVDTQVRVQVTEGSGAAGDARSESVAVDWLADGRIDVSRALAQARFATGLDRSSPQPEIHIRWVPGLDADRRRSAGGALRARTTERACANDVELCPDQCVASEYQRPRAACRRGRHAWHRPCGGTARGAVSGAEPGARAETVHAGSHLHRRGCRRSAPGGHRPRVRQYRHRPGSRGSACRVA